MSDQEVRIQKDCGNTAGSSEADRSDESHENILSFKKELFEKYELLSLLKRSLNGDQDDSGKVFADHVL